MRTLKTGLSCMALFAMTAQSYAADLCSPAASAALKTAAVQQELMVAGFTCNAGPQYNHFVTAHRLELQKSDADLMSYFKKRDHGKEAGYDSYKTKAANLSANRSASDGARYCQAVAGNFDAADHNTLKDFIAGAHLLISVPEACAIKYDREEMASAAPAYGLSGPFDGATAPATYSQATAPADGSYASPSATTRSTLRRNPYGRAQ